MESGPLPPGQPEETDDDDGEQDDVPPPHADGGALVILRVLHGFKVTELGAGVGGSRGVR